MFLTKSFKEQKKRGLRNKQLKNKRATKGLALFTEHLLSLAWNGNPIIKKRTWFALCRAKQRK